MKIWKLTVLDEDTKDWDLSTYKGDLIVRAETEHKARMQATNEFGIAAQAKPGQPTRINPWSQKDVVGCDQYSGSEFSREGEPSVLKKLGK